MPNYNVIFDTNNGPQKLMVTIQENELINDAMPEILHDLRARKNHYLRGSGDWVVKYGNVTLDKHRTLAEQGIQAGELLHVSTLGSVN